jgi:hypothetical protein
MGVLRQLVRAAWSASSAVKISVVRTAVVVEAELATNVDEVLLGGLHS